MDEEDVRKRGRVVRARHYMIDMSLHAASFGRQGNLALLISDVWAHLMADDLMLSLILSTTLQTHYQDAQSFQIQRIRRHQALRQAIAKLEFGRQTEIRLQDVARQRRR